MKALIQKDLRENLKLGLIGLVIFSLMLLQSYRSSISELDNLLTGTTPGQAGDLQPLLAASLLMGAAVFCAVFGALLGWVQTRNEGHRDLWAFLVHRPVTRTEIFWGKTIAGLCLYVLGAGLPLAVLAAVVAWPGHVAAPFEWRMVLPLACIWATGLAFYFAGLLTGVRQARWYASRALGLGLAILPAMAAFNDALLSEFWPTVIAIVLAVVILATAAWGAYQTGGFYNGQPAIGKLALILSLVAGCAGVLFAGVSLLFMVAADPFMDHSAEYSYYQMTRDGVIYKLTMRNNELVKLEDLEGHPLLDSKTGVMMRQNEFNKRASFAWSAFSRFKLPRNQEAMNGGAPFFSLVNITDKTLWYLDRHGNLIGYDGRTRSFIGRLDDPHESWLVQPNTFFYYNPYNDRSWKLLPTAKAVYRVDFKARAATPIFNLAQDDEIGGYADEQFTSDDSQTEYFFFTTRRTVFMLDSLGKTNFSLPYQPGYGEYPQVEMSILDRNAKFAVWFHPDGETNSVRDWKMPIKVTWIGTNQVITKTAEVPSIRLVVNNSWTDDLTMALMPPPAHVMADTNVLEAWNLLCFAFAAVSAIFGLLLTRRYNFSAKARAGWTLFVLLFGPAGLLTLVCAQEWPAREICPNCKKRRAVDQQSCEHCQVSFPPPEKNGTEIFGPLVKAEG